ncbi:MAG: tetratricopeptide repeat protein, partial [Isosphaeraceae bacterium]
MNSDQHDTDLVSSRYRVIRPFARGGLGEVFLAYDTELDRLIALKEVRRDIAPSPTRQARFLLEARVTGRLEHPGIVPVYGLGTHGDGRAYYAMRFIKGETLRAALGRWHAEPAAEFAGLAFRLLLGWFVTACKTMAYAHSQGVLHRDLKPTNIMLGEFGETLVVDWGLAKTLAAANTTECSGGSEERGFPPGNEAITSAGQTLGSPGFMSPEQAAGNSDKLGPASDIYSLGATLYVMLTDRTPFEGETDLVLHRVRWGEFPPPREVKPQVPRPLEAICLKAMALRPEDRYQSALDLAGDIECWLADRPVSAHREPWTGKTRRWIRRHQTAVSSLVAALVVGFLALGLAVPLLSYAWRGEFLARQEESMQRTHAVRNLIASEKQKARALASERKATEERDRAEKALAFLVQAFRLPDPTLDGRSLKASDLLERAAKDIEPTFADAPLMKATLLQAIGETFSGLGLPRESLSALERASAIRREALGPDHPGTLVSLSRLAAALEDAGRIDQAIPLYESVLARQKKRLGADHHDTLETTNDLAVAYWESGQASRAIPLYQTVLEFERARLGDDHPDTLTVMDNLAVAYAAIGEPLKAIPLHETVLAKTRAKLGQDSGAALIAMNNLARAYELSGQ